jgi:hypothetical protein
LWKSASEGLCRAILACIRLHFAAVSMLKPAKPSQLGRADRLSMLLCRAEQQASSSDPDQARRGAAAFELIEKAHFWAARNKQIARILDDVLEAQSLVDDAGADISARDPVTGMKFSNSALRDALSSTRSKSAAARKAGCSPRTIYRRIKKL